MMGVTADTGRCMWIIIANAHDTDTYQGDAWTHRTSTAHTCTCRTPRRTTAAHCKAQKLVKQKTSLKRQVKTTINNAIYSIEIKNQENCLDWGHNHCHVNWCQKDMETAVSRIPLHNHNNSNKCCYCLNRFFIKFYLNWQQNFTHTTEFAHNHIQKSVVKRTKPMSRITVEQWQQLPFCSYSRSLKIVDVENVHYRIYSNK